MSTKNEIVSSPLILISDVCKFHSAVIVPSDFEICALFSLYYFILFFILVVDESVFNLCSYYVISAVCDEIYVIFSEIMFPLLPFNCLWWALWF